MVGHVRMLRVHQLTQPKVCREGREQAGGRQVTRVHQFKQPKVCKQALGYVCGGGLADI